MKWLKRALMAWGLIWLIVWALIVYDVIDGMIRRWRERRYGI